MPTETDEPTKEYYVLHYRSDSHYAKDSVTMHRMYMRYDERWGELPERIDKIECPMSEWREFFGE